MQTLVEAPMKRFFSAIIPVALATICSAQTTGSFTTYLTLKQSGLNESTWNTNWSAGFLVPLYTTEKWSVQTGLEYQRLVMEGPGSFSIPAMYGLAQTESDPGHGLMLYVQSTFRHAAGIGHFLLPLSAGVQYQRTGESRMMAVDVSRTPYDPTLFVRVGTRRSTDVYGLALAAGVGYQYPVTDWLGIQAGVRFTLLQSFQELSGNSTEMPTGPVAVNYLFGITF